MSDGYLRMELISWWEKGSKVVYIGAWGFNLTQHVATLRVVHFFPEGVSEADHGHESEGGLLKVNDQEALLDSCRKLKKKINILHELWAEHEHVGGEIFKYLKKSTPVEGLMTQNLPGHITMVRLPPHHPSLPTTSTSKTTQGVDAPPKKDTDVME